MPTPTDSPETPEPAQRAGSGRAGRRRDRTQHDRRHGEDVVSDEPDSQGETLARARGDSSGQRPADHLTHRPRNASRPPLRRRRRVALAWAALSLLAGLLGLRDSMNQVPIKPARTITLTLLAIAVLAVAGGLSAPSASASSLGPRQEMQQLHQQSNEPALTSLTVTSLTTQPLAPAFSSTVRYYTVVVDTAVTRITVAGTAASGDSVAYEETTGTAIDDADTNTNGHQVDIPTAGKRLNVVVTRTATAATTTYGVLVIHEGPSAADTVALMALYNSAGGDELGKEHQLGDR